MEKQEDSLPGENVWFRYVQKQDVGVGEDLETVVEIMKVVFSCNGVLGFSVEVGTVDTVVKVLVGISVSLVVFVGFSVIGVFVGFTVVLVVVSCTIALVVDFSSSIVVDGRLVNVVFCVTLVDDVFSVAVVITTLPVGGVVPGGWIMTTGNVVVNCLVDVKTIVVNVVGDFVVTSVNAEVVGSL